MKRKIRFIIVACFIAGVAATGFNISQNHKSLDVSLADLAVMAKADGESGGDCLGSTYIDRHPKTGNTFYCEANGKWLTSQTCETGGSGCTEIKK